MAKSKFELTTDLVKVEPEFVAQPIKTEESGVGRVLQMTEPPIESIQDPIQNKVEKEPLGLKINKDLKREFQIWCVSNRVTMTDALEEAINRYLKSV